MSSPGKKTYDTTATVTRSQKSGLRLAKWAHGAIPARLHTRESLTTETGEVEVEIDIDAIVHRFARQALFNRSGRATVLHGLIKARVKSRAVLESSECDIPVPFGYTLVDEEPGNE